MPHASRTHERSFFRKAALARRGPGRARSRAARKRALTAESSSRWAGAITRTSEDQVRLAEQNLRAERASLQARIRRIGARLAVPADPPLARPARPGVPADGSRHPHRQVPRPAGPDGIECGPVRDRRGSRVYVPVGGRAQARPPAGAPPQGDPPPPGPAGDRATRARSPGQAPRDREPHRPSGGGTASPVSPGRDPGQPWRPDPHPGSPPPHEAPGSHPAPRPAGLTGSWQATRQPRTVRGRRLARTISR